MIKLTSMSVELEGWLLFPNCHVNFDYLTKKQSTKQKTHCKPLVLKKVTSHRASLTPFWVQPWQHVMQFSATAYEDGTGAQIHVSIGADADQRLDANLCLVIDVSGSMQMPAVLKDREAGELSILDIVQHSCRTVIHSLSASDHLAIVAYSDQAEVKLALTAMDDAGKAEAEAALSKLRADGQTNLWQGHSDFETQQLSSFHPTSRFFFTF